MRPGAVLAEQGRDEVFHATNRDDLNALHGSGLHAILPRTEYMVKSEFPRLIDALLNAVNGPNFSTQTHLRRKGHSGGDGDVRVARKYGRANGKVQGGVLHAQSSGDIEEDILGAQSEPTALLQDGQKHIEAAGVKSRTGPLWGAVDGGTDEGLDFDQ